jgi:hypothetical protein
MPPRSRRANTPLPRHERLVACAHALEPDSRHFDWLKSHMYTCARELDERIVPEVLTLLPLMPVQNSYNVAGLLEGKITMANAAQVLAAYETSLDANIKGTLLEVLGRAKELPTELFEPLVQLAAASEREEPGKRERQFVRLLAMTGHPDAAPHVLAGWRAKKQLHAEDAWLLVRLGRRTQAEPVRGAMREMAADPEIGAPHRPRLLLALLSMHDAAALDLVVEVGGMQRVYHPYAKAEDDPSSPGISPVQYLLYKNPDPPHGFTEDEVIGVLSKILVKGQYTAEQWSPHHLTAWAMTDQVLGELVRRLVANAPSNGNDHNDQQEWVRLVLERSRTEAGRNGMLRDWTAQVLQHGASHARQMVLAQLQPDEVKGERARIEALTAEEDEAVAVQAVHALAGAGLSLEPARLAANRHPPVRMRLIQAVAERRLAGQEALVLAMLRDPEGNVRYEAATCLGALVSKEAVPGLIELLRDGDTTVRKAAADALTRIRFYHEQQAHWDRVLKGLDATPASAAEKLLLQGKPGAPKEQRLLAITSLGTLGVPEALPFLIDWTQDADAAIAKAAKDAITQIHLQPRR